MRVFIDLLLNFILDKKGINLSHPEKLMIYIYY